jgi:hypothetical protein
MRGKYDQRADERHLPTWLETAISDRFAIECREGIKPPAGLSNIIGGKTCLREGLGEDRKLTLCERTLFQVQLVGSMSHGRDRLSALFTKR